MISIKEYVTQFVDEYINKNIHKEDVRNFLLKHERKHILISNLSRELLKAEYAPITLDILMLKNVANDFARIFCNAALNLKKEQLYSETARITEERKASEYQEYLNFLKEEPAANAIDINTVTN